MFESRMPVSPFTREVFVLSSRGHDGALVTTSTRLFEPAVSRRRSLGVLERALVQRGSVRNARIGQLRLALMGADEVVAAVAALADAGTYCYD